MADRYVLAVIILSVILIGVITFLLRDRLVELNFDFFKGLIKFGSKTHVPLDLAPIAAEGNELPFERQYMSHAVLHILQKELHKTQGHHAILEETTENFHPASTPHMHAHRYTIAI